MQTNIYKLLQYSSRLADKISIVEEYIWCQKRLFIFLPNLEAFFAAQQHQQISNQTAVRMHLMTFVNYSHHDDMFTKINVLLLHVKNVLKKVEITY